MEINVTIIGQIITFAILVLFTMKFVWPPINKMMEERAKKIADGLSAAEKGRQELLDAKLIVEDELKKVQMRAIEIIDNAEKQAMQLIEQAKSDALIQANKIIENANIKLEIDIMRAKDDLRLKLSHLVVLGVEQILKVEIDEDKHRAILTNLQTEL